MDDATTDITAPVTPEGAATIGRSPDLAGSLLVDSSSAAAMMGISRDVYYNHLAQGRVPEGMWVVRPGGGGRRRMYPAEAIARLAEELRSPFPPAGMIEREAAAQRCGVSLETLNYHQKQGRLVGARLVKKPGSRARVTVFPLAGVDRLAEEIRAAATAPFPPAGFVDRYEANRILGVGNATLDHWKRTGRFTYDGVLAKGPNGVACRIYAIAELQRARDAMAAAEAKEIHIPAGFVDFDGAATLFGQHKTVLNRWQIEGRLGRGKVIKVKGRPRFHVFAIAEMERVKSQMEAERAEAAARPVAPAGFIELHAAAITLGVSPAVLHEWEKQRRVTEGRWTPIPGTSARTKVYRVEEIERLREELRHAAANFPPTGWLEIRQAARRANVSMNVWKRWMAEGRVTVGPWVARPAGGRCKLFSVAEIDRLVVELGRDHHFFMESDGAGGGAGGWRVPDGHVGRGGAAEIFGVAESTFVHWQGEGWITCGRWARLPPGAGSGGGVRRVYPVEALCLQRDAFRDEPYVDPHDASIVRVPVMSWGKTPIEAIIDAADLPRIAGMRWHWVNSYGGGDGEAVRCGPADEQQPFRRVVLALEGPEWKVIHVNGNPLDCRRENVILRTINDVIHSQRKRRMTHFGRPPTSRFKGVCWDKRQERWTAHIQNDGIGRRLGSFHDEVAAAEAYDEAAKELFGEHGWLNFPDGVDGRLEREAKEAEKAGACEDRERRVA